MGHIHEQYKDLEHLVAASERNFGYTISAALFLFTIIYSSYILASLAIALTIITIISPSILKNLNAYWTLLGAFLQKIATPVIMLLIYILVFLPIAMLLNICRKNTMLNYNTAATSYWLHKDPQALPDPMKYQF